MNVTSHQMNDVSSIIIEASCQMAEIPRIETFLKFAALFRRRQPRQTLEGTEAASEIRNSFDSQKLLLSDIMHIGISSTEEKEQFRSSHFLA